MSIEMTPQRWKALITVGATVMVMGAGLGIASAEDDQTVGTVSCPTVDIASLGNIPASAVAEVQRNLELLNTQVAEANNRLRTSVGQGGAAFVDNAILGPLASKRTATINRIATAIGRQGVRPNLDVASLSACAVGGGAAAEQPSEVAPGDGADQGNGNGGADGNGGNGNGGADGNGNGGGADAAEVGTIACPDLDVSALGAIPASATAEVNSNLAQLDAQIAEANNRLRTSVGQGGSAFVRNAILGPLADKRTAAINRIATAIGRQGVRPSLDVAALSECSVVD